MNQQQWQNAYEKAPDTFHQAIRGALKETRRAQLRPTLRYVALAAVLTLFLCGTAVAVMNLIGVLSFLPQGTDPNVVQTALPQACEGGLPGMSVSVRDAASDGIAVHLTLAFSAADPKAIVLSEFDAQRVDTAGAKQVLVAAVPEVSSGGQALLAGVSWLYETPTTLVVDLVLDLRFLAEPSEGTPLTLQVDYFIAEEVDYKKMHTGRMDVLVVQTLQQQAVYHAVNLPLVFEGFMMTDAEFIQTPLGLYASYTLLDDMELLPSGNLWIDLADENGQPLPKQHGGYKMPLSMEYESQIMHVFYNTGVMPENIVLLPYDSGTREQFAPIALTIEKDS